MAGFTIQNAPSGENTAPASTVKVPLSGSKFATLATIWQYAFNYVSSLTAKTTLTGADILPLNDSAASNVGKGITWANTIAMLNSYTPDGTMWNGKIAPTVASNNLTLTLQTASGGTPSLSDPVLVKINGVIRTVAAATSCTLAAATNWGNAGGAELATIEVDWFAYAVWDSNSSIVALSCSRVPHGTVVSTADFSATTTNAKHLVNYANFTVGDDVVNIGRFAATLSAGAGYTWTVPTFTSTNLIQKPIYNTRLLSFTSTTGGITVGDGVGVYKYRIDRDLFDVSIKFTLGSTSAITGGVSFTIPITGTNLVIPTCWLQDTGTNTFSGLAALSSATVNVYAINTAGTYMSVSALSSTVPYTWASTDYISLMIRSTW